MTATPGMLVRLPAAGAAGAVRADDADAAAVVAQAPRRVEARGAPGVARPGGVGRVAFDANLLGVPAHAAEAIGPEQTDAAAVRAELAVGVEGCLFGHAEILARLAVARVSSQARAGTCAGRR